MTSDAERNGEEGEEETIQTGGEEEGSCR